MACSFHMMMTQNLPSVPARSIAFISVLLVVTYWCASALAASIIQLDMRSVVEDAELIFKGQVQEVESRWNDRRSHILTHVTFGIDEVIAGDYAGSTIVLKFVGGEVGSDRVVVHGMTYPELGERGVYFVEELGRTLMNPLIGWDQGHFKIKNGRLYSSHDQAVMSVNLEAPRSKTQGTSLSEGVPTGVILGAIKDSGMSSDSFIEAIKYARP